MKILVVSDSHSGLSFMRRWAKLLHPEVIIHLGDYYDDGGVLMEEFPGSRVIRVPGNCDRWRMFEPQPETLFVMLDGVGVYLTHGHLHGVKSGTGKLLASARVAKAGAVLYGHTHIPDCRFTEEGMLVMNPGSCGSSGGTVGLIELERGKITSARILTLDDMEEYE